MINPSIVEGQIAGGAVQGIGGALLEDFVYDEQGNPLTTTFIDYLLPTATDVPDDRVRPHRDAGVDARSLQGRRRGRRHRSAGRGGQRGERRARRWSVRTSPSRRSRPRASSKRSRRSVADRPIQASGVLTRRPSHPRASRERARRRVAARVAPARCATSSMMPTSLASSVAATCRRPERSNADPATMPAARAAAAAVGQHLGHRGPVDAESCCEVEGLGRDGDLRGEEQVVEQLGHLAAPERPEMQHRVGVGGEAPAAPDRRPRRHRRPSPAACPRRPRRRLHSPAHRPRRRPARARASATRRQVSGWTVAWMAMTPPAARPASTPSSRSDDVSRRRHRSRRRGRPRSLFAASSAGVRATAAAVSANGSRVSGRRAQMVSGWPASTMRRAIGAPWLPRPMNPTRITS